MIYKNMYQLYIIKIFNLEIFKYLNKSKLKRTKL